MISLLKKILKIITAASLVSLLLIVILGILSKRLTLHITWTVELAEFLLAWLVMLGGTLAYMEHSHLGVDLLVTKLDSRPRAIVHALGHLFVGIFSAIVMTAGGALLFLERWNSAQILPSLGIRKAWFYFSVPLAGVILTLSAITFCMQALRDHNQNETPT